MKRLICLVGWLIFVCILSSYVLAGAAPGKETVNKDEQKRIERVEKGIKALLDKEKCTLDTFMLLTTRGNTAQIRIVPLEPEKKADKTGKKGD